ncbi:MAG: SRPBCC family protein [Bacteroidota bacterium]
MIIRLVILSAALLLSLTAVRAQKRSIHLETVQHIEAEPAQVFAILQSLERFPEWSPFLVEDPEQKYHVTGVDGEVGSTFHWEGVAETSLGSQTLKAYQAGSYLRFECDIQEPFASQPVFEYQLRATEHGTEVTQSFDLSLGGFAYLMIQVFGVKKHMKATNELGLMRLKTLAEAETQPAITYHPATN